MNPVIDNYLQLAQTAKKAGNNAQCEQYCNKILELESNNSLAWALKGSAAGWDSTLSSLRIEEMLVCFGTGINCAPNADIAQSIKEMADADYRAVVWGLFALQCDRFKKWPDAEEAAAFAKLFSAAVSAANNMTARFGVALPCMAAPKEFCALLATTVNNCAIDAEKAIRQEYEYSNNGYPTDYDFERLLDREGNCKIVIAAAIEIAPNDDEGNMVRWQNMINNHSYCISAKSYKSTYIGEYTGWKYVVSQTLTPSAIASRQATIAGLQQKIDAAQERIRQKRNNDYWNEHAEYRQRLEREEEELRGEKRKLEAERARCQTSDGIMQVKDEISALEACRASIGFLALKEKKNLNAQIEDRRTALGKMQSTLLDPIDERLKKIDQRVQWITKELTRDR